MLEKISQIQIRSLYFVLMHNTSSILPGGLTKTHNCIHFHSVINQYAKQVSQDSYLHVAFKNLVCHYTSAAIAITA